MPPEIESALLERYSRGEITRRDVAEQIGEPVSFGALLAQLHEHGLPLPRIPSDRRSPGVQLVKRLAQRDARAR